jgi:uncharacterized protein (TIGR02266 family)
MNKQIIIVDDSKIILMYIGLLLKRMKYEALEAANGFEALRLLSQIPPDLVMIDVDMKSLDSTKLLRLIRAMKATSRIPVILISSDPEHALDEPFRNSGYCEHLIKPLKVHTLYEIINRCLFRHEGYFRRHVRVPYRRQVSVAHNGEQHELFSDNLSEGGMYIRTTTPFPAGSDVVITLALDDNVPIIAQGIVVHRSETANGGSPQPSGMGIKFTVISEEDCLSLRNCIENIVAADIFEDHDVTILSR